MLAGQDGSLGSHGPIVDDGKWFLGELRGTTIAWENLVGGRGCELLGRTTACAVEDGVEIREGFGPPRRVETQARVQIEKVLPLGFRTHGTMHLGFEQGELPRVVDDDHERHFDGSLVCEGIGPTTALPPLARDEEQERAPHSAPSGPRRRPAPRLRDWVHVTDALKGMWIRQGGTMLVRFVDAFTPGTGVRELRFPLAAARKDRPAAVTAVARDGEEAVAFVVVDGSTFLIPASGTTPGERSVALRPSRVWLGAEGSMVTQESHMFFEYLSPRPDSFMRVELVDVSVTGVDTNGFSFVAPGKGSAARGRIATGRPAGPPSISELERVDRLGVRPLLFGERCTNGEAGDRLRLGGVQLRVLLEGEIDGVLDARLEVVDRGTSACLAGISATDNSVAVRMDLESGRADFVRADVDGERHDMRCELTP